MTGGRRLPETGRLLRGLAFSHAAVGLAIYRRELRAIVGDGVANAVPYRGPKATAFWFLMPSPPIWLVGRLLSSAERAGDVEAVRAVNRVGAACAAVAVVCMPVSGFWGLLAISLRGLWHARHAAGR